MPKIIDVPGTGHVEFPDSMADEDISRTIRLHTPEPEQKGSEQWKTWALQRNHDLNDAATSAHQPSDKGYLRMLWDKINPFQIATAPGVGGGDQPGQGIIGKTVNAVVSGAVDQGRQAVDAAKAGRYSEAVGHGIAAAVPVVGPMAAHFADAAGTAAGSYMGGNPDPEATKEAVTDAAAAGVMLAAPNIAGKTVEIAGKIAPRAAAALRESAEGQYARALNPRTNANKFRTAQIVPKLLDENVKAMTLKGLQAKSAAQITKFGEAIGDAWDALPLGTSTELQPIFDRLQDEIVNKHSVPDGAGKNIPAGPEAERAISNINKLQQTLMDVAETDSQSGKLMLPVGKARFLRQYFDGVAESAGRSSGANLAADSTAKAHAIAADSIRNELAQDHPNIAALNKEFSFWKDVNQVVSDTLLRKQGQAPSIGAQAAQAVGFVKGGPLGSAAVKALTEATGSPAWRTVDSVLRNKLANAIAKGHRGPAEFYAAKIERAVNAGALVEAGNSQDQ